MQIYGISEREMTPAEHFEDFHKRMGLRNRMSNALMAIALFEARSKSKNLTKYVADGLGICRECLSTLEDIAENYSTYRYSSYTSKVLLDILTSRLMQKPDISKVERYKKGLLSAQKVFETMREEKEPDQGMLGEADKVIQEIDKEIESTYAKEESLYRGLFIPR